nr:hypothetical protein [Tanacetum cinerariifolium]
SLAGTAQNAPPTLKDLKFWTAEEKKTRKIDRLARSFLIQGLPNDIYSLIDNNKTAKDLWDALERQMCGSKYDEQDRKAAILYEYETFEATEGEQLLDTYLRYLQVINDLKKMETVWYTDEANQKPNNKTAKDLWDALERQMCGSKYDEQDRKAAILYEYETFEATEGEQLLDTYLRYLQVINDLKKYGYKIDNCELNYKFLNNLQPEWKQYGTLTRQTKNLMDINIDALYNILKQNQGDVNDALGYKKKVVMVTSDPIALVAEKTKVSKRKEKVEVQTKSEGSVAKKTKVSKRKEKVEVQTKSEGSDDEDISDLKNIIALLAKAFNRNKYYSKPTNNNLRTSSASSLANKKPEYVKSVEKKEDKKLMRIKGI